MAAVTRHWSTVFNGMDAIRRGFKAETDKAPALAAEQAKNGNQ